MRRRATVFGLRMWWVSPACTPSPRRLAPASDCEYGGLSSPRRRRQATVTRPGVAQPVRLRAAVPGDTATSHGPPRPNHPRATAPRWRLPTATTPSTSECPCRRPSSRAPVGDSWAHIPRPNRHAGVLDWQQPPRPLARRSRCLLADDACSVVRQYVVAMGAATAPVPTALPGAVGIEQRVARVLEGEHLRQAGRVEPILPGRHVLTVRSRHP
jgi:hypothetical protein